ncbi:MAG: DUF4430 domain-containing protein [Lachnospiraceae bacterium]|nr:DUF4430 domain-containing protein [Lachnospiraceae bacterium]
MKKSTKIIIGIVAVIAVIAILFGIYKVNAPKAQEGTKAYTVEVKDKDGNVTSYTGKTDQEFLRGLMDELAASQDFAYTGSDGDYGLYIESINGITADYNTDGAYWSIYVNGEYGMYGADQQPVADGDTFTFAYEVYSAQ